VLQLSLSLPVPEAPNFPAKDFWHSPANIRACPVCLRRSGLFGGGRGCVVAYELLALEPGLSHKDMLDNTSQCLANLVLVAHGNLYRARTAQGKAQSPKALDLH
jgi:hypothetical protein